MDVMENLPGSTVKPKTPQEVARSSYHDPDVMAAVEAYDPYISDKTEARDAKTPERYQGGPV